MAIFLVPRRAKPCSAAVSTFAFLFVVTLAPGPSDAAPKVVVKPKAAGKATKAVAAPPEPATLPLVPLPKKVTVKPGTFTFGSGTRIQAPVPLRAIAERFRADLVPSTGLLLPISGGGGGKSRVVLAIDPRLGALGDEGYRLTITPSQVLVRARRPAGIFYGLQTVKQLLPPALARRSVVAGVAFQAPCVDIEDQPRFGWRGSHVDVGRHFQPKETILKHLDVMALHKLNVFHWHLTDDQGWRIQIKKYPKLTEVGAWRKDSALGPPPEKDPNGKRAWKYLGRPHGGFYTQDDVREVVRYAADRFITVVPEIEMPGHARAAIAAYPELGNTGKATEVATSWGVFEEVYSVDDHTLGFVKDVLTEVLELFPSKFIHVGGDEVPKKEWKESAAAQTRMKALGLNSEEELQSWFIKQIDSWLAAKGRRLIGWDEILEGGLAPGAAVMSWRGEKGGIAAARSGHDVVMAPGKPTYFDHAQAEGPMEPVAISGAVFPLEMVYAYEPVPAELNAEQAKHVLGSQGQLWTEYIPNGRHLEYMAWPRLSALAEVLWSPRETRNFDAFKARLAPHLARLKVMDVNFRPLDGAFPPFVSR
jgi:hexosaminidase